MNHPFPAQVTGFYAAAWLGQLALGWVALGLLHVAVSKGGSVRRGPRLVGEVVLWEATSSGTHSVGRVASYDRKTDAHAVQPVVDGAPKGPAVVVRLHETRYFVLGHKLPMRFLFGWDVACFLATSAAAFAFLPAAYVAHGEVHAWQVRAALKGARIAYSLTAFPFFMVSLPIYKDIFATAKKTGYSKDGVCLPAKAAADYAWVAAGHDDEGD